VLRRVGELVLGQVSLQDRRGFGRMVDRDGGPPFFRQTLRLLADKRRQEWQTAGKGQAGASRDGADLGAEIALRRRPDVRRAGRVGSIGQDDAPIASSLFSNPRQFRITGA